MIEAGTLRETRKESEVEAQASYSDTTGIIRKYIAETGSEDSALVSHFYYDETGILRYVLITGGAINGSELKHEITFDTRGNRLSETHEYIKGPGYTFPAVWPDSQIVFDPAAALE
jgi:hypothetical protein